MDNSQLSVFEAEKADAFRSQHAHSVEFTLKIKPLSKFAYQLVIKCLHCYDWQDITDPGFSTDKLP